MASWVFPSETEYYHFDHRLFQVTVTEDYQEKNGLIFNLYGKNVSENLNCRFTVYNIEQLDLVSTDFVSNKNGDGLCEETCILPIEFLYSTEITQQFYFRVEMGLDDIGGAAFDYYNTSPETVQLTTYTIAFNINGGVGETPNEIVGLYYREIEMPESTFTRSGYTFMGWGYDSVDYFDDYENLGHTLFLPNNTYSIYGDTILYAVWKPNTYTVTLNPTYGWLYPWVKNGSAGVYDSEGNMVYTWEELLTNNVIYVNDGVLTTNYDDNVVYNSSTSYLDGKTLVIDSSVTSIGEYGLACAMYTNGTVVIPESVISIDNYVFAHNNYIEVIVPTSVTSIGSSINYNIGDTSTINYTGTEEQWNVINKSDDWNDEVNGTLFEINYNYHSSATLEVIYNSLQGNNIYYLIPNHNKYKFLGFYSSVINGVQVYDENGHCVNGTGYWIDDKWVYDRDITIYAHWNIDNYAYYKLNGEWVLCQSYVKVDGGWKPAVMKVKTDGDWNYQVFLTDEDGYILTDENGNHLYII